MYIHTIISSFQANMIDDYQEFEELKSNKRLNTNRNKKRTNSYKTIVSIDRKKKWKWKDTCYILLIKIVDLLDSFYSR